MKHRGGAENTGLGADAKVFISGKNMSKNVKDSLLNKIAEDCYNTFSFEKFGYCEAGFDGNEARFGVEPTYQFEKLKLIVISKDKEESSYVTGFAVGYWASAVKSGQKRYGDYLKKSKFVRFVDKWHSKLFS